MEVKIFATNLTDKPGPQHQYIIMNGELVKPISLSSISAICGVKTEHSRLKHIETCEECHIILISLS
jgi:hypothetical protein